MAVLEASIEIAAPRTHVWVRGVLLAELGRAEEALVELAAAERLARNSHEAAQVRARISRLENRNI